MCTLMQECIQENDEMNSEMKICRRRRAVFLYTSQEERVSLQSQIIYLVLLLLCGGPN